jgi:hypothetical protein
MKEEEEDENEGDGNEEEYIEGDFNLININMQPINF